MLRLLMPPPLASAEEFGDLEGALLYPEEAALVAGAVAKRRGEFVTARACARRALEGLGLPPGPILTGARGAPVWPDGVVGSLTHCAGYRAAALGRSRDVRAIGIDAEPDAPLPDGVLEVIALDQEIAMLRRLVAADPTPSWDRLLFSAKETVYKAWFPLTHRPLDFSEARIEFETDGTFTAELLVPAPLPGFRGRWLAARGLVLTAITVPVH